MTTAPKPRSKKEQIVAIFNGFSRPATIEEVTKACMESGVWAVEEDDKAVFRARADSVRKALNDVGAEGLPTAISYHARIQRDEEGQIEEVNVYVQRQFWTAERCNSWLKSRVAALKDDYRKIETMVRFCEKRFPDVNWWALVPSVDW